MSISNGVTEVKNTASKIVEGLSPSRAISVFAPKTNSGTVYIGSKTVTTETGFPVEPGGVLSLDITDSGLLYCIGTTGDKLRYIANVA